MEDLDTQRTNAGYASQLRRDLTWLGLTWDRETTPQSQRQEAYQAAFRLLEEMGLLYPCYCTRSRLHRIDAPHATDGVYVYDGRVPESKAGGVGRLWPLARLAGSGTGPGGLPLGTEFRANT